MSYTLPGISSNGLFWTVTVADSSVDTNRFDRARMQLTDFPLRDFTKVPNSLMQSPSVPATISLDVRWFNETLVTDQTGGFSGRYFGNGATVTWSVRRDGFSFKTDEGGAEVNEFTLIGNERNGVFFPKCAYLGKLQE